VIREVILDVDGTLVDSNHEHARAWGDALAEYGIVVTFADVRPLIGMGGDQLLPKLTGIEAESPLGKAISARRGEIFRERYLPRVRPFARVPELLAALRDRGLVRVVASSAEPDDLRRLLDIAGATELIDDCVSSDDVERSKPDPDLVGAALARAALPPAAAVMLGDTPYDVVAARRAGVDTVALRCGGWSDAELAGAIAVYDDPADLLANLDRSPLGAH
jgi:HAD superfamily hydrolase (TIGR01509 family)